MGKSKRLEKVQEAGILFLSALVSAAAAYLYGNTAYDIAKTAVLAFAGAGCIVFAIEEGRIQQGFLFDNEENLWRFTALYFLSLAGSVVFPMLPVGGWPYLVIFVGLTLFSGQLIALCAGSVLLMLSVLLSGASADIFMIYFVIGVTGVLLFRELDEAFRVALPLGAALLVQGVCLCLHDVLLANETLNWEMFIIPVINTLVCLILLLILLKFFSFSIIYRTRDAYMDINDPECPLLVELKEFSKEEYYHAVHTAYLCDRIARGLMLDAPAAKAVGYYHKIGVLKGGNDFEHVKQALEPYAFPARVLEILKEYLDGEEAVVSKETAVLLISDTMISSVSYLFSREPNAALDYEKLIQAIFKKKLESGVLNRSRISIGELEEMKKILSEEKLYYDFLR